MELISIIMGVYNAEDTIDRCINSILNQTYTNWEFIICDDGSTDETYNIAKTYEKMYPNKIVLLKNKQNMRLAASLNRCLKVAQGEYVARMDADDESSPNRLKEQVNFLNRNLEYSLVGTNMMIYDGNTITGIRKCIEIPRKEDLLYGSPFAHPTIMMRKNVYDALDGYTVSKDTMRAEDLDLWFRFYKANYKGYNLQQPLYKYHETIDDYKKRSIKAAIGTSKIYLKGYRLLNYKKSSYIFCLKPIVMAVIPSALIRKFHHKKENK